jgi:hypothetical protein
MVYSVRISIHPIFRCPGHSKSDHSKARLYVNFPLMFSTHPIKGSLTLLQPCLDKFSKSILTLDFIDFTQSFNNFFPDRTSICCSKIMLGEQCLASAVRKWLGLDEASSSTKVLHHEHEGLIYRFHILRSYSWDLKTDFVELQISLNNTLLLSDFSKD